MDQNNNSILKRRRRRECKQMKPEKVKWINNHVTMTEVNTEWPENVNTRSR